MKCFISLYTIEVEQMRAQALLVKRGVCERWLENSPVVSVEGSSRHMTRGLGEPPIVGLSDAVDIIEPVEFDTREDCMRTF